MMLLAQVISFVANPIFVLIGLPYFLVIKSTRDSYAAWQWTVYTWGYLLIFVAFVVVGVRRKIFSDFDVSNRRQRPLLYLFGIMLAILYVLGLVVFHGPRILFVTIIGIVLGIFIGILINTRIKASVHVAALAALLTALSLVYRGYFVLSLFLLPVVCWARVKIRRHTVPEVVVGGVIGGLLSLLMYFSSKSFIHL